MRAFASSHLTRKSQCIDGTSEALFVKARSSRIWQSFCHPSGQGYMPLLAVLAVASGTIELIEGCPPSSLSSATRSCSSIGSTSNLLDKWARWFRRMLDNEVEVLVAVQHDARRSGAAVPESAGEAAPRCHSTEAQASEHTALTHWAVFDQHVGYVV